MSHEKPSNKTGKSEAEYKYTEDQAAGAVEDLQPEPPVVKPSLKSKLMTGTFKKKLMVTLFILSLVSVVYQFMGNDSAKTPNAKERAAQAQQLKLEAEAQAKKKVAVSPVKAQPVAAALPVAVPVQQPAKVSQEELKSALKSLPHEGSAEQVGQIKELQEELQTTNQSVEDLQTALLNLATSVQKLSGEVEELTKAQQAQKQALKELPAKAAKSTRKAAPKEMGRLVYNVRALVPGRATLYIQQGDTIRYTVSVKVGDLLSGYGLVQAIDSARGLVATSAGGVITYGPNDS